ncbi:putative membrane protein [Helicobacter pylori CPY1662]|nr:putative membrane protein [Helicobacter pylori CPY1662]
MAFGKKDKIFKLALEFLLLAAFHCCLALYTHTSAFIFCMVY